MSSRPWRSAARIVSYYVILSSSWIVGTDLLVQRLTEGTIVLAEVEIFKGLLFVAVTGTFLFGWIAREIREREKSREQFRSRTEKFLSLAAHELKTPLAVIRADAELLERFGERWKEDRRRGLLNAVILQCDRMNRLIVELIELSREGAGKLRLHCCVFDLAELVNRVVRAMRPRFFEREIVVERIEPVQVVADSERLEEVLFNLLENAARFSPERSRILVDLEQRNETATVSVRDFGRGISEHEKPHIFEKFYQSSDPAGAGQSGMGIGLFLCREIIRRHGGEIGFENSPAGGAVFRFRIPIRCVAEGANGGAAA